MLDADMNEFEILVPLQEDQIQEFGAAIGNAEVDNCKLQQSFFIIDGEPGMGFELTVYTEMESAYGILYKLGEALPHVPYFVVDSEKWENRFATVLAE